VIRTFACKDTRDLFNGIRVRRWVNMEGPARRKLEYLNAAHVLGDLRIPPGNRLEALRGEKPGASTASASTTSSASVLSATTAMFSTLKSPTIIPPVKSCLRSS